MFLWIPSHLELCHDSKSLHHFELFISYLPSSLYDIFFKLLKETQAAYDNHWSAYQAHISLYNQVG